MIVSPQSRPWLVDGIIMIQSQPLLLIDSPVTNKNQSSYFYTQIFCVSWWYFQFHKNQSWFQNEENCFKIIQQSVPIFFTIIFNQLLAFLWQILWEMTALWKYFHWQLLFVGKHCFTDTSVSAGLVPHLTPTTKLNTRKAEETYSHTYTSSIIVSFYHFLSLLVTSMMILWKSECAEPTSMSLRGLNGGHLCGSS